MREVLDGVDPTLAPYDFTTVDQLAENSYVQDRFATLLIGLFGALGLVPRPRSACTASCPSRWRGARASWACGPRSGARGGDIVSLVFRDGARLVIPGLALGLLGALAVTRLLASQLHGVQRDRSAVVRRGRHRACAAAGLASWFPRDRAARVDPMVALRSE